MLFIDISQNFKRGVQAVMALQLGLSRGSQAAGLRPRLPSHNESGTSLRWLLGDAKALPSGYTSKQGCP